jgi:membrane fusion protein, multidrug efflux system
MKTDTVEIEAMKRTKRAGAGAAAVLMSVIGLGACGDAQADGTDQAPETAEFQRIINVEVTEVRPEAFREEVRLTGVAWANQDVQISAEESGVIREVLVEKGSRVEAGQPLFRIDASVLSAQVAQARAQAELAGQTWDRRRRLWEEDRVGSELAYLEAKFAAEQTAANLEALQARLDRTTIRAPFSGILESRAVEVGTLVSPGQTVGRVVDLSTVKVAAGVPERYAPDIHPGGSATVYFDVLPGERFPADIDYVGSTVNPGNRTFPIEIEMDNPGGEVKPEMVANVVVERRTLSEAMVVPQDALVRVEDGYVVFVADEGTGQPVARVRPVQLGPSQTNRVVIESGLEAGDRLIVVGQRSVADGDRINVVGG